MYVYLQFPHLSFVFGTVFVSASSLRLVFHLFSCISALVVSAQFDFICCQSAAKCWMQLHCHWQRGSVCSTCVCVYVCVWVCVCVFAVTFVLHSQANVTFIKWFTFFFWELASFEFEVCLRGHSLLSWSLWQGVTPFYRVFNSRVQSCAAC